MPLGSRDWQMYAIGTGLLCPWVRVSTNALKLAFVTWFNCPNGW